MNPKKVLLIGWDAADWKVINPLMDAGLMPGLQMLVNQGTMGNLATLHPVLSPMLWTSIATGKRPYKHGIYGFSEPDPATGSIRPITNLSRKTKAVWNILSQQGYRCNVVGWWPSFPAEPINGAMVSDAFHHAPRQPGTLWLMKPEVVYPESLSEILAQYRVYPEELTADIIEPFIPKLQEIDLEKDKRPLSVARVVAEASTIQAAALHLLDTTEWDFTAVYFDAIDHFCHGFMKYHPPRQDWIPQKDFELYHGVVNMGYQYHDLMLQALLNRINPNETVVILVSDHGFHPDHLRPHAIPKEPAGPAAEHREHGVFLACGPGIRRDHLIHGATLLDVTPTVLSLFGQAVGEDMDGDVLTDIYLEPRAVPSVPSWDEIAGEAGQHPPDKQLSATESAETLAQLADLGYIEKPNADQNVAVRQTVRELDYNLAQAYMDAGRFGDAVGLLENLWHAWPLEHRFGVRLAYCYQMLGQTSAQRVVVEAMLERRKTEAEAAKQKLKDFYAVLRERKQTRDAHSPAEGEIAEQALREAEAALVRNELETPAEDAEKQKSLMSDKEREQYLNLRAQAQFSPYFMHYLLGNVLFDEGDYQAALDTLAKAEKASPNSVNLHNLLGQVYLAMKRHADARARFQAVLQRDPHNADAYLGLTRIALERGLNRAAIRLALRTVGLRFHFPMAHYCLGVALERQQRYQRAIRALQAAVEQNPNFLEAHRALEHLYSHRLYKYDKAKIHTEAIAAIGERIRHQQARPVAALEEVDAAAQVRDIQLDVPTVTEAEQPACRITIVSGLPRSGTSMMMQMLEAGGMPVLIDGQRTADDDNPKGYYEYEKAKQLRSDRTWLPQADGKAVKIIAQLLPYLPPRPHLFQVIFMERPLEEVIALQTVMLRNLDKPGAKLPPDKLQAAFAGQVQHTKNLLKQSGVTSTQYVDYHAVLKQPREIARQLALFLGRDLDLDAMAAVVNPSLRRQKCYFLLA